MWTAAIVASTAALAARAAHSLGAPAGLTASYESLGGPSRDFTGVDPEPSAARVIRAWGGTPPDAFAVTWRGILYVPYDGAYTFATRGDGETAIYLDGRKILENGWDQPDLLVRDAVHPDAGAHNITITYHHNGGAVHLGVLWARGNGEPQPMSSSFLSTRRAPMWQFRLARASERWTGPITWIAILAVIAAAVVSAAGPLSEMLARWGAPHALAWIVAGSLLLNVLGISWGIEGSWGVLEVTPKYLLGALSAHFAHGWSHAYPLFHFMVLAAAASPLLAFGSFEHIAFSDPFWLSMLLLWCRAVTVLMAAGTLVAIYFAGAHAFNARAGLFAAGMFALAAPFVYFAKMANVDVPYLFWFALSLVFYMRLLGADHTRDYIGLAVTAALAVCTKDQAYGLYLGIPVALLVSKGLNRRMLMAGAVSILVFVLANNVIFNFSGFVAHVRFIIGPGNETYRVYEPTLDGRAQLLAMTLRLVEWTWGWPFLIMCVAGIAFALYRSDTRRAGIWLLITSVTYYLSFINVILYVYDRFTMPIALVLALFGGLAFDRLLAPPRARPARLALTGAAFAYTLLYSSQVDVLLLRDSRYGVEHWLAAQTLTPPDDLVVSDIIDPYLPRLGGYHVGDVQTIHDLQMASPKFFILNVDYMRGEQPDSPAGQLIAALEGHTIGYTRVLRARTPSPWPWLPGAHPDLCGDRTAPIFVSNLRYINPTIEVFQHDTTLGR